MPIHRNLEDSSYVGNVISLTEFFSEWLSGFFPMFMVMVSW